MARMIFKNGYNYDSATRQLDTGDLDHILDTETDMGYAFSLVVDAAIVAGLADFTANFINDNDLLTQLTADTLYELIGAVAGHVAALDPHTQYLTEAEADALYEALGAAAAAIAAHEGAANPHPIYLTQAEGDALYLTSGGAPFTSTTVTITTASLAVNAVETGTVALPEGARLKKINPDRACRVRLYLTTAHRTADAARAIGTDVDIATDHGLLFEYVAEATIDAYLSPSADIYQGDGESTVYYAIENRSAGISTVAVIFDYLRTE